MRAFVSHVSPGLGAQLVLAGPAYDAVDDDPESRKTFETLVKRRAELLGEQRRGQDRGERR